MPRRGSFVDENLLWQFLVQSSDDALPYNTSETRTFFLRRVAADPEIFVDENSQGKKPPLKGEGDRR